VDAADTRDNVACAREECADLVLDTEASVSPEKGELFPKVWEFPPPFLFLLFSLKFSFRL